MLVSHTITLNFEEGRMFSFKTGVGVAGVVVTLLAGCSGGEDSSRMTLRTDSPSPAAAAGEAGPPVDFVDQEFNYSIALYAIGGLTVLPYDQSRIAPPGEIFPSFVGVVTNKQKDRPAPWPTWAWSSAATNLRVATTEPQEGGDCSGPNGTCFLSLFNDLFCATQSDEQSVLTKIQATNQPPIAADSSAVFKCYYKLSVAASSGSIRLFHEVSISAAGGQRYKLVAPPEPSS